MNTCFQPTYKELKQTGGYVKKRERRVLHKELNSIILKDEGNFYHYKELNINHNL